ncbi:PHD-zinc-finger like domain-containing protein [Ilyonectria robusta]|uniref:PHD-zinc-finger like domain-containing protein n=1 Tax=Ilyonectria robusta TaxID=1079257 RepID=UPI001E8D5746|nr:PHD-zinc-finger like domain-containing protein [Ilyonectria robusta]KAH8737953.1 PHD-zinc-finger like domain-containing protein [Ilyonectria robusta]
MAPTSPTPRRPLAARRRGRPPGTTNAARAARQQAAMAAGVASEPPPKKRRYIPGGPGGGGRFIESDLLDTPSAAGPSTVSRSRNAAREVLNGASPSLMPRRERSARTRATTTDDDLEEMHWGSAAAMAASVKQAEDYKPREERSWEDFHPNLDIEGAFIVLRSEDVDGIPQEAPDTPIAQTTGTPMNSSSTPSRQPNPASTGNTPNPQGHAESNSLDNPNGTPSRRTRRPTRDVVSFYNSSSRPIDFTTTPKTPKILPIQNQTPKEKLDLKLPSYRKTNRIELFESKTFGQARYVDKAMSNVGYQESDHFIRPDQTLIKASDGNAEDDADQSEAANSEEHIPSTRIGRVEYDMDEQDDMWLEQYNMQRKQHELEEITREVFEITMTKIEKEWHALEKRIPKPNPKPPQTHRPRSSSAAAVNGEPQLGEEPDSKCAICDDGDCENTNAIVFCDGCNLAVHQECYGVPFIPEGQWLCRKCQLCGRGVPTCIFCPNTDGAFKQTNSSKWAHLLCAMWIPEVSLGNHTFMEPVMDVEKVPKNRWKLTCYICRQRMGACIQCSNKNCYQAFHVTCARRSRLFLKMKTSQGALAVLDGGMVLKAFCDRHCPVDYAHENGVHQATRTAKKFYKRTMRGRIWADNHAMANAIAAQHRNAITDHPPDESQMTGAKNSAVLGGDKKKGQAPKNLWKLPSGAPIIPQAVFEIVEASIQRFPFRKRKDYLSEACRYWTLKREARRGAALLKRLQLQMESFSSMELTRRDFAAMGPSGKARLARRIQFAQNLIRDLEQLKTLSDELVEREQLKVEAGELEQDFVDECYFPVAKLLSPGIERAISLDKNVFMDGLEMLQERVETRFYVTGLSFAADLCEIISTGISTPPRSASEPSESHFEPIDASPTKNTFSDIRERRKLGKRILKAVQPYLETALRVESEISQKPFETLQKELETMVDNSVETGRPAAAPNREEPIEEADDTIMVDAPQALQITVKGSLPEEEDAMDTGEDGDEDGGNIEVNTSGLGIIDEEDSKVELHNGIKSSDTPPDTDGYVSRPRPVQSGPPTPPQSNGSLGLDPADPLTEGGVLWYLKGHEPRGTSVLGEHWAGRDAVRMLSEDLTDMDDEELKGLGMDVDHGVSSVAVEVNGHVDAETTAAKSKASKVKKRRTSTRRR